MTTTAVFHSTFAAMGTRFSMVLPGVSGDHGENLARRAEDEVLRNERLMSRHESCSALSEVNRAATRGSAEVPDSLWEILQECRRHWVLCDGAFDITRGASEGGGSGFSRVDFDGGAHCVRFGTTDTRLDLGGIGKGIALECVADLLRAQGVRSGLLSFGESSIKAMGKHPSGRAWPVGIADLAEPTRACHTFHLNDASVSTSGNRPRQAGHVVGADGACVEGPRTLSVAARSAIDAEALSTALLALPAERRDGVMQRYPDALAVEIAYPESGGAGRITWQHGT